MTRAGDLEPRPAGDARHRGYVVDPEGRPTGYLDLLELVLLYVDALEAPPLPSSG